MCVCCSVLRVDIDRENPRYIDYPVRYTHHIYRHRDKYPDTGDTIHIDRENPRHVEYSISHTHHMQNTREVTHTIYTDTGTHIQTPEEYYVQTERSRDM